MRSTPTIVAPVSEPLKAVLRRLNVRPPSLPIVSNVTGDFYPENADADTMLDLLGRQVASPVQFIDGLHTLYAAGARVFVEVGPKKALHGFVEDVLGDDVLALFTNHPKIGDVASFNQALCGLYAAGLGYCRADARRRRSRPRPPNVPETAMTDAQYAELGRHLVDVRPARPASPKPTRAVTAPAAGAGRRRAGGGDRRGTRPARGRAGLRRREHRPHPRRSAVHRHDPAPAAPARWSTSTSPAWSSASPATPRSRRSTTRPTSSSWPAGSAPLDVVSEFGVDSRPRRGAGLDAPGSPSGPVSTRCATPASRWCMHYKTTTLGTKLPDRWGLPESMRDDTGVDLRLRLPRAGRLRP